MQETTGRMGAAAADPAAWARALGLPAAAAWLDAHPLVALAAGIGLLASVSLISLLLIRRYLLRLIGRLARRSPVFWDEALLRHSFFHRLSWALPLLIVHQGIGFVPHLPGPLSVLVQRLAVACLVLVAVRALAALLAGANEVYNRYPMARHRPLKGYLQVVNIVAHLAALILIVAALMDRSPLLFFSGLGAMTAILLLIFRDTLLSLVAGIQLTANDLIRVGDWIEMPQFSADGDVVDIALNSVSVQNWDRTITVIPTHKFLEHSFRNWRGMQESGGRRIKRSLMIDVSTIRFLAEDEVERFGRFRLLKDYVTAKKQELESHNREYPAEDPARVVNTRRLTNIGTFRAYVAAYLRQHPGVHQEMTFLVRQLQPGPDGLPLEIYVFSRDVRWAMYEAIQADIFDHILAIVPEFGLRVYQRPSGADLSGLTARRNGKGSGRAARPDPTGALPAV